MTQDIEITSLAAVMNLGCSVETPVPACNSVNFLLIFLGRPNVGEIARQPIAVNRKGHPMVALSTTCETPKVSLFTVGKQEAHRHKWIESEKAGKDLGEAAIRHWKSEHWWGFLRSHWIEHISGECYWNEFKEEQFRLLVNREFHAKHLLNPILERLRRKQENLHIIQWAITENLNIEDVFEILEALDINNARINPDGIPNM